MNCDACAKLLTEDDTHESILCTACINSQEKIHCIRCHCVVKSHKVIVRTIERLKVQRKVFLVFTALFAVIALISPFAPHIALKLVLGLITLPITIGAAYGIFFLLFPTAYRIGSWINDKLDWDLEPIQRGPGGSIRWLLGILAYSFPFIFYGVGALVYNWIWIIRR